MSPELLQKHADLLTDYCLAVQPKQRILINGNTQALPLLERLCQAVLERGAEPVLKLTFPDQMALFQKYAAFEILERNHPSSIAEMQSIDASIAILTTRSSTVRVEAARAQRYAQAARALLDARSREKWCVTLFPTQMGAELADMTLPQYQDFVSRAMFLDHADPVSKWLEVRAYQADLIERIREASHIRVVGPETDLRVNVAGRMWRNSDGQRNMPSGEVFTSPLENSAEGQIYYALPTVYGGQTLSGIRLELKGGKVVRASAEQGEEVLFAALETDAGAKIVGEIGIGTNYGIQHPSKEILFDEKIGGTVHFALGNSYAECGGLNKSAIHWDMICDLRNGGQIWADDVLIQENGKFIR